MTASSVFAQNFDAYRAYVKGLIEQRNGNLKAARTDYEKGIADDPDATAIYKDLIYLYWQLGQKELAVDTAETLNKLDAQDPDTTAFIGNFYMVADSTQTAKEYWDKTLKMDPRNTTALSSLANQYLINEDFPQSEKYWKLFLSEDPESIMGYLQLGFVQEKRSENKQALATYDELIKLRPEVGEAYVAKARVYENMADFKAASEEYKKLLVYFPKNAFVLIYLGRCYYLMNDLEAAEQSLQEARQIAPQDLNAAYWLGAVYEKEGRINDAIKEFEFITRREENFIVMAKLGYFYTLINNRSEAQKYFLKALKKEPTNDEVVFFLGINYMEQKKYEKAVECFKKLVEKDENFSDGYYLLGLAYERLNNFDEAEANLKKAIEINSNNFRAMNLLSFLYAEHSRNFSEAESMMEKVLAADPQNGYVYDTLGWLYYKWAIDPSTPRGEKALRLENSVKVLLAGVNFTRDPLGYSHLGDAYMELSKYAAQYGQYTDAYDRFKGYAGDAWLVYWLSYEASKDPKVKKKMQEAQSQMTEPEFFDKLLYATQTQFLRQSTLEAGFLVEGAKLMFSKKTYVVFNYVSGEGMSLGFPTDVVFGSKIYLKDMQMTFEPRALEDELGEPIIEILEFARNILDNSGAFYGQFDSSKAVKKGDDVIYSSGTTVLTLSAKDVRIKSITDGNITVDILKELPFMNTRLPSKIRIKSKNLNFTITLETKKYVFATDHIKPQEPQKK
jgi:tetratricopeptide (TPR) repeat protein